MHILMFGMSSYPGGIENYIYNYFVNKKMSTKHTVDFITYEPTIAYEDKLSEEGYVIHRVPHLKKNPWGYFIAVRNLVRENKYDCVYVNMLTAANVLPIILADIFNVKRIVLHAHANSTIKGISRCLLHNLNKSYCNKKASLRLACSKDSGRWIFDDNEFIVIPNAIDCNKFYFSESAREEIRKELQIGEDELVLGHIGRIAPEKNHFFMLEILKEILKIKSDVKMIFVGDGYLCDVVKKKMIEMQLQDSVIFYGTTNQTDRVYSAFDYFLFPSTFEGFGMAALEAQASGLKVFCSDTLSDELNVTGTVKYLSLQSGASIWAQEIINSEKVDPLILNEAVKKSDYNIEKQIERLSRLLYE